MTLQAQIQRLQGVCLETQFATTLLAMVEKVHGKEFLCLLLGIGDTHTQGQHNSQISSLTNNLKKISTGFLKDSLTTVKKTGGILKLGFGISNLQKIGIVFHDNLRKQISDLNEGISQIFDNFFDTVISRHKNQSILEFKLLQDQEFISNVCYMCWYEIYLMGNNLKN